MAKKKQTIAAKLIKARGLVMPHGYEVKKAAKKKK